MRLAEAPVNHTTPTGRSRLLAELPSDPEAGAVSLAEHRRRYPAPPPPRAGGRADLIALVEHSGLSGRGGAAFPTARKLEAVAAGRGPALVVVNGTEGEPASGKDSLLLQRLPHLVLDGALVAAAAVGADRVAVGIDRSDAAAGAAVSRAVAERSHHRDGGVAIAVRDTPPRYVAGESSALVAFLNNGAAKPTATPPRQRGVAGRPTLVQNVETLAHLAQIARFGPDWFRQSGTPAEPGTVLLTVSGAVGSPEALLVGGFFGTWVAADLARQAPFSRRRVGSAGRLSGGGRGDRPCRGAALRLKSR